MIKELELKLQDCVDRDVWNTIDPLDPNRLASRYNHIILEWTDTGCFEATRNCISFNDCNTGHTFCLRQNFIAANWTNFQLWYLEGINSGLYRTDVPIQRQEIIINDITWEYTRWMRPGKGIGQNLTTFNSIENTIETFNEMTECYFQAILAANEISPDRIPEIGVRDVLKDDTGIYIIKTVNEQWVYSKDRVISKFMQGVRSYIQDFESTFPSGFLEEWTANAETKWKLLNE